MIGGLIRAGRPGKGTTATAMLRLQILLVLALALAVRAQKGDCLCSAMVQRLQGTTMVYQFPTHAMDDCSDVVACHAACTYEWEQYTNNGDLTSEADNGLLVGENMCNFLQDSGETELEAHSVYSYYKACDWPWQTDGHKSNQTLCCTNGNYNYPCQ